MDNFTGDDQGLVEEPIDEELPVEGEEDVPVEGEEEPSEEVNMDEKVPFVFLDEEGNELDEEEISLKELQNTASFGRNAQRMIQEQNQFIQSVLPLTERIEQSQLLQWVLQQQDQGIPDNKIQESLATYYLQNQGKAAAPEEEPEFDTMDDKINYLVEKKLEAALKQKVEPLTSQLQKQQFSAQAEMTLKSNESVIESALDTFGYQAKLLNPSQVSKLQKAIQTYYPGIDLRKVPLNKEQASMIVQIGLGYRKGALKEERQTIQAKNINRQALVPNIQKGSGVRETARVEQPRRDGVSIAERQKKWSSLF